MEIFTVTSLLRATKNNNNTNPRFKNGVDNLNGD